MAAPPPVLPPFNADPQSLEEAVDEQLSLHAQVRFLKKQNQQLAERQGFMNRRVDNLAGDVGRIADGQTKTDMLLEIIAKRLKRMTDYFKIQSPADE